MALASAHRAGGLAGTAWLTGLVIAAGIWCWVRLTWRAGGDFLLACAFLPLVWTTAGLHWLARPHVAGWIWLMAVLMAAERAEARFPRRYAVLAAAVGAAWANTHPSFVLGAGALALYAAGEGLAWLIWNKGDWQRARWYGQALLWGAAGTLLTPYGWALHRHVFAYLGDTALLSRVAEFQTFNFHTDGAWQVGLVLALTACGAGCALAQRNLGRGLVLIFFAAMALRTARGLPLAAMAALPLANGSITLAMLRARELRPVGQRALHAALLYSGNLRRLDEQLSGLAWAPVVAGLAWMLMTTPAMAGKVGFPAEEFPVAAMSAVAALPQEARILAPDKYGGFLIYRFQGERKVYFDGRSDFYGSKFMEQYIRLIEARPEWRATVLEFGFTHALVPAGSSLRGALEAAGWRTVYRDGVAWLMAGPHRDE
ncbi:MAG: hypothetical protein HY821_00155 [Acidobacteria bacterium]|nr:hypothetical protein [Acidobacteriota bacterium]